VVTSKQSAKTEVQGTTSEQPNNSRSKGSKNSKKAAKKDPYKSAMRSLYWLLMAFAFGLVIWLGYEGVSTFLHGSGKT
jgi:hypothetical protein